MSFFGETTTAPSNNPTFAASSAFFTAAASPTDVFTVTGSASKTVKILKVYVALSNSAMVLGAPNQFAVVKRSSANTGGTSTSITPVPLDSNDTATATAANYTANPTGLGTLAGQVSTAVITGHVSMASGVSTTSAPNQVCLFDADKYGKAITLRGTAQQCSVNILTGTLTGTAPLLSITVIFTES